MLSIIKYTSHPQFSGMCLPLLKIIAKKKKSLLFSAYLKFLLLEHFLSHNIEQSLTHFFSKGKIIHTYFRLRRS